MNKLLEKFRWSQGSHHATTCFRGVLYQVLGLRTQAAVLTLLGASLVTFEHAVFAQEGMFVSTGSMTTARWGHTATLLNNGMALIAGGGNNSLAGLSSAELYDPATETFKVTGSMTTARHRHTATLLNNGLVLIAGGIDNNGAALSSAELYDPATGTFTLTGSMTTARLVHTATLVSNGLVLIAGGNSANGGIDPYGSPLASAELYDPGTGTFTATGSMPGAHQNHTATLLQNGMVLIAGGVAGGSGSWLASAALYDSATETFTATGTMTTARESHTATLLKSGMVLIAGGDNYASLSSAELYDPSAGTFTATANMVASRDGHTATMLNNGTVLMAGGNNLFSAELYDPSAGTFTATANMITPRGFHTATMLNAGMVLLAGGYDKSGATLSSVELYEPLAPTPQSLSFSSQPAGTTSASQTVTLTNHASSFVAVTAIAIGGTNASDFAEANNCVQELAAGASCSINVTFTPGMTGPRTAALAITTDLVASALQVSLNGTGVTPDRTVMLSSTELSFPGLLLGTSGVVNSLSLINAGNDVLKISGVTITGTNSSEFAETDTCVGSIAPGANCTINVTFNPTAIGPRTATLTIADNATSPASPQVVPLSGTGQGFSLASSSPTATVTAGQTATYAVSISPAGGFSQTVFLSCTGAPPLAACNVSPTVSTPNGTNPASVTVTITTTARGSVLPGDTRRTPWNRNPGGLLALALALSAVALMTSYLKQSGHGKCHLATLSLLLVTMGSSLALIACGGGGSSAPSGTPAGNYTLTVSGTFTSSSATVTRNTKLTLVVQ